tara:strand:- start:194 stop:367 length:174 start_codon:yes stop_codon:yes gene_type:complete
MSKKKKAKRTNPQQVQKVVEEKQLKKNNTLVLNGVLLSIISIGLLIYVLSKKVFDFS